MIEYKSKMYTDWGYIAHTDYLAITQQQYPTVKNIKDIVKQTTNFAVDIGAGEVPPDPRIESEESQCDILFRENPSFGGLLIDCNKNKIPKLQTRYKDNPNVKAVDVKITTDNVLGILEENKVPEGFYLTIDIDGFDLFVIEKILTKHRPSFIVAEINEKIPPPIKFTVNDDPEYSWGSDCFYGFSIQCLENIIKEHNYKILMVDYDNVILVPDDNKEVENVNQHILDAYMDGYVNKELVLERQNNPEEFYRLVSNPNLNLNVRYDWGLPVLYSNRKTRFPWNFSLEMLQSPSVTIEEKLKFIKEFFSLNEGKYTLEVAKENHDLRCKKCQKIKTILN